MMTADGVITESVNEQNVSVYHYHSDMINTITEPNDLLFKEADIQSDLFTGIDTDDNDG